MTPHFLVRLALRRRWALGAALLLWIVVACLPLASGVALKAVFDALAPGSAATNIWVLFALFAAAELAAEPLSVAWIYAHLSFENALALLVRHNLFHRAISSGRLTVGVGEALARFRDDVDGAIAPLNEWYRMVGEGLFTIAAVVVMARIEPTVTAVALVPTAFAVVLLNRARSRLHSYTLATRKSAGILSGFLGDVLANVIATKAAAAEDRVGAHFDDLSELRRRAAIKSSVLNELLVSASGNVSLVARAIVLLLATAAIARGDFTVGDFALFSLYMEWVFELPRRVGRLLASQRVAAVSTDRLSMMSLGTRAADLTAHAEISPPKAAALVRPKPRKTADDLLQTLSVRAVTALHPDSSRGVRDATFAVERGQFVVVTGRAGGGKTTLLRAILGLVPHEQGEVSWNGAPVQLLVPPRAGYVPQAPVLFAESLRENLALGLDITEAELADAIERSRLTHDLTTLEHGIDTAVGPGGARLSGGQLLRAALARALLRDPELLILDDVSTALDLATEQQLWTQVRDLGVTILTASTRRHTLDVADRIILLQDGAVVGNGSRAELLQTSPLFTEIWTHG